MDETTKQLVRILEVQIGWEKAISFLHKVNDKTVGGAIKLMQSKQKDAGFPITQ